jgi:hypothetical protein
MNEEPTVLDVSHMIFEMMQEENIDIPIAMGGIATAVAMIGVRLGVPKESLVESFKQTVELIYADYDEEKETRAH